ncbi:MAG: phosphopantetheine-binding protein [Hyphomicrobiales bacterium]
MSYPDRDFIEVLTRHLKYLKAPEDLTLDGELRGLGLDSKDAVDLLLDIEDLYGVVFPDDLLNDRTFATAGSLWQAIESTRGPGAGQ